MSRSKIGPVKLAYPASKAPRKSRERALRPDVVHAYAANILRIYRDSSDADRDDGMTWYRRSRAEAIAAIGYDAETSLGMTAAASVNRAWPRNVLDCVRWINTGQSFHYRRQMAKVRAIRIGKRPLDVLKGQKERDFYSCLYNPTDPDVVVVDSHAWCIAKGNRVASSRVSVPQRGLSLREVKEAYRVAARAVGILPSQMQAVTWVSWRRRFPMDGPHRLDKAGYQL